ncbi:MAG: hypothetical protein MJ240_11045 [Kiritimatiellae bacterium]|nr:hypothetical protein [Kiritimatiellia bacterium]
MAKTVFQAKLLHGVVVRCMVAWSLCGLGDKVKTYPLYVVNVPAASTNALASAPISEVTLDGTDVESTNAITYARLKLAETGTFVKVGAGQLNLTQQFDVFTGQWHIEEGTACVVVSNGFGKAITPAAQDPTDEDAIFVSSGASIVFNANNYPKVLATPVNKLLVLEGEGAPEWGGAMVFFSSVSVTVNHSYQWCGGMRLSGNATIRHDMLGGGRMQTHNRVGHNLCLDLGGHELIVTNGLVSNASAFPDFNHYGSSYFTNGTIRAAHMSWHQQTCMGYKGGPSCNLRLTDGSFLIQENYGPAGKDSDWTLSFEKARDFHMSQNSPGGGEGVCCTNFYAWGGPVYLGQMLPVANGKGARAGEFHYGYCWPNYVYGPGGLTTYRSGNEVRNEKLSVHLLCPTNAFEGSVGISTLSKLYLYRSGALPANGGGVYATNAEVHLCAPVIGYTNENYVLPSAEFYGTGLLARAGGRWNGACVKKGDGELAYNAPVGGPLLDIQGGSVKFARAKAGLFEGYSRPASRTADNLLKYITGGTLIATSTIGLGPEVANSWETNSVYDAGYLWPTYSARRWTGYVWNRANETKTWRFATTWSGYTLLKIDGVSVISNATLLGVVSTSYEMTPGPHEVELVMTSHTSTSYYGSGRAKDTDGWVWPRGRGLMYDPDGHTGFNARTDFREFVDPGDGSLFTTTTNATELADCLPDFTCVKFAAGTYLDLNGHDYALPEVSGLPAVTNGNLTVNAKWTVDAAALASSSTELTGAITFSPDAVVTLLNPEQAIKSADGVTLLTAQGGVTVSAQMAVVDADGNRLPKWYVRKSGANTLKLVYQGGFVVYLK